MVVVWVNAALMFANRWVDGQVKDHIKHPKDHHQPPSHTERGHDGCVADQLDEALDDRGGGGVGVGVSDELEVVRRQDRRLVVDVVNS